MTTKVNFKINPETLKLDVSIENDEELDSIEINFAKRILSLSTQLNFVQLPYSRSVDLGASIIIEKQLYEDEDGDYWDGEEVVDSETLFKNLENNEHKINESETKMSWTNPVNEFEYYDISVDVEEAKKIVGGLTVPSVVATMLVYEMLKRTIKKVEISL